MLKVLVVLLAVEVVEVFLAAEVGDEEVEDVEVGDVEDVVVEVSFRAGRAGEIPLPVTGCSS